MTSTQFTPIYDRWRHGGWYVTNVTYPSGAVGCVSRNYPDKQWRIVCDKRDGEHTYPSRDAAARAELELAQAEHQAMAPWLEGLEDVQLRYSAVSLFGSIAENPSLDLEAEVERVLRLRKVDAAALTRAGKRYIDHVRVGEQ